MTGLEEACCKDVENIILDYADNMEIEDRFLVLRSSSISEKIIKDEIFGYKNDQDYYLHKNFKIKSEKIDFIIDNDWLYLKSDREGEHIEQFNTFDSKRIIKQFKMKKGKYMIYTGYYDATDYDGCDWFWCFTCILLSKAMSYKKIPLLYIDFDTGIVYKKQFNLIYGKHKRSQKISINPFYYKKNKLVEYLY